MPGVALVTIGENQWNVEVASTTSELITGLSGRASLVPGTGMLFILPARQLVTVTTEQMLFPIDIIFIKDNLVLDIASNISPGNLVEEATPCDGFLEINAGEAALVEVGDAVNVELLATIQTPGFDINTIISFAIPLAVLGFVVGLLPEGSSKKELGSGKEIITKYPAVHGEPRRRLVEKYGSWAVGRAEAVCPEDDIACVEREAKRLSEVYKSRYGEEAMEYVTIISPGQTVFHIGDVVSRVALEKENKRVRVLGENEATWQVALPKVIPEKAYIREKRGEILEEIEYLPDSPEFLAYTIADIGYADKLENAFKDRMLKVRSS